MRRMKNVLCALLSTAVIVSLTACGDTATQDASPAPESQGETVEELSSEGEESTPTSGMTAGVYEVTVAGHNGDISMQVTVDDSSITNIEVLDHEETAGLGDAAIEKLVPQMLETQSVAVDAMTGATVTSEAVIAGVTQAIQDAGGNVADFSKTVEAGPGETIEKTVDVVVVGGGGAGMAAAVEASKAGASTLVIEKLPKIGGNTAICSGNIYATGSQAQEDLGLTDNGTVEDLFDFYMTQAEGRANPELVQLIAERSGPNLDWLVYDIGVEVKHREPGASHRSVISETSGVGIINGIAKRAEAQGTEIMLETAATELIVEDGKVVGVKAKNNNNDVIIHAKSVILTTGGYDGSDEGKAKYAPGSVGHHSFSSPGNVGDAIEMVKAVDGKIVLKGGLSGIHLVADQALNSPLASLRMINYGVGVTDLGYRYANESMTSAFDYYNPMVRTGRKDFFNIVDSTVADERLDQAVNENAAFKADTIEELARLAGIPEYTLAVTIEEYNAMCEAGVDTAFGKNPEDMAPLVNAPFYAVKIVPNTNGSFGGLVTDLDARVLDNNDVPVEGLYAAGACANADFFYLRYPVSGSSVSMCLTMGRIAGETAADYANS